MVHDTSCMERWVISSILFLSTLLVNIIISYHPDQKYQKQIPLSRLIQIPLSRLIQRWNLVRLCLGSAGPARCHLSWMETCTLWTWRRATSPWAPGTAAGPKTGREEWGMRRTMTSLVAWESQPNPPSATCSHPLLLSKSPTGVCVCVYICPHWYVII